MIKDDSIEEETQELLDQIGSAFGALEPPGSCRNIRTQEDFEKLYAKDKFGGMSREFYDSDEEEVVYLIPFVMRAYLDHFGGDVITELNLQLFLFFFGKFNEDDEFIKNRYLSFYRGFDKEQRECICTFLAFLKKHDMDDGFIDDNVIEYWCDGNTSHV